MVFKNLSSSLLGSVVSITQDWRCVVAIHLAWTYIDCCNIRERDRKMAGLGFYEIYKENHWAAQRRERGMQKLQVLGGWDVARNKKKIGMQGWGVLRFT